MSLIQFLRILWARRVFIAVAALSCVLGAYVITLVVPPRWAASSRVMLDLLKPDPVTGEVVAGPAIRGYIATQTELITDYTVAGQVADQLGWLSDPQLIAAYNRRPKSDSRDFRRWLADIVIGGTKVKVLEGSNILEITYTGSSADQAKLVADALRKGYVDASLNFKRDDATRSAEWFDAQAQKATAALNAAQGAETAYERANGIVMADDKTDLETARLRALSTQGAATPAVSIAPTASASSIQLAQLDAQIAQESQTLGPNHPELQQLRAQRASVAAIVAQDQAAARAAASSAAGAGAGAVDRAVAQQKSRVLAQSDKLQALSQLQTEVDLRQDELQKTLAKGAELRQEAAAGDTGLTPLAAAATPKAPIFPNMLLIIPGSLVLGLAVGVFVSLLSELVARRVRGVEDLESALDAPLLAVVAPSDRKRRQRASPGRSGGVARAPRRKAARA